MTRKLKPLDPKAELVTAPAGSGKTTLLLRHYLRLLAGSSVDRIVAITFTRKAAAELAERLAHVLRAISDPAGPRDDLTALCLPSEVKPEHALRSLAMLDSAPVCTVDAFALALVQEFALEAHFRLRDGTKVWIDGPVEPGGDPVSTYESAAREQIESLSPAAKRVLEECNVGKAIADVAKLARTGVPALWEALSAGRPSAAPPSRRGATLPRASIASRGASAPASTLPTLDELLVAFGQEFAPAAGKCAAELQDRLAKAKNIDAHKPAIEAWLRKPAESPPPALIHFLVKIKATKAEVLVPPVVEAIGKTLGNLGLPTDAALAEAVYDEWRDDSPLKRWLDPASWERAATYREALVELALAARDQALRGLARNGRLGFDDLLQAATNLCLEPPSGLAGRYDVLMVDELQDTNPAQLAFYRAFAKLSAKGKPMRRFYVGDARQSIYRFRDADPYGWERLIEEADQAGTSADLLHNFRSSRMLVAAQKSVFEILSKRGDGGVEPLDDLEPGEGAAAGLVEHAEWPEPVVVVDGAGENDQPDAAAVAAFARRLTGRWKQFPDETAAVIVPSWRMGAWAAQRLRGLGIDAQLWGDRTLLSSRVAADLNLLLASLLDPSDDVAVAGLLKHPSSGVSDRGLLLLRQAGLYGRLFGPERDLRVLDETERTRLAAALEVLVEARGRVGREPTAEVLERVVSRLGWRPLIAAGPEGEDGVGLAQLEILLDVVRDVEAGGVDPREVLERLEPPDPREATADNLPLVRLHGRKNVVVVTTVFGAKGLQFDHVAVLRAHDLGGSDGVRSGDSYALAMPQGRLVMGVKLDPSGGLRPAWDPLAMLGRALGKREERQEALRMFYVAFTRAKSTVTFGLGKPPEKNKEALLALLRQVFLVPPPAPAVPAATAPAATAAAAASKPAKGRKAGKGDAKAGKVEKVAAAPAAAAAPVDPLVAVWAVLRPIVAVVSAADLPLVEPLRAPRERTAKRGEPMLPWREDVGLRLGRPSSATEYGIDSKAAVASFLKSAKLVQGSPAPPRPSLAGLDGVVPSTWEPILDGCGVAFRR